MRTPALLLLALASLALLASCGGASPSDGGTDAGTDAGGPADSGATDMRVVDAPPGTDAGGACLPAGGSCTLDTECCSNTCFVGMCS